MPQPIEFYFDFISPYGYLGSLGIEPIAARHGRAVDWRPILLGVTVLKVMGLKPLPDTPLKGDYLRLDVPRCFRLQRLPYNPANGGVMAPLPAARGFTWLKDGDPELACRFARAVYRSHWSEGLDMSTPAALAEVAAPLGIEAGDLIRAIGDDAVKAQLRGHVEAAVAKGVFGSPSFIVDGELFWGADRLDQVEQWLATGGW